LIHILKALLYSLTDMNYFYGLSYDDHYMPEIDYDALYFVYKHPEYYTYIEG